LGRVLARQSEADVTTVLLKLMHARFPGSVVIKHSDKATTGIPDASVTWNARTLWIEVKLADPSFTSTGLQELTCARLARAGRCTYVIYRRDALGPRVALVPPDQIGRWREVDYVPGFDHAWVVTQCGLILAA
jgi:hypothetical protein